MVMMTVMIECSQSVIVHIPKMLDSTFILNNLFLYQFIFRAEPIPKGSKHKTVHEELAKSLTMILRPANADQVVVVKFLNNSWFFFEILIKSMTQYLIDGERVKVKIEMTIIRIFFKV